MPLLIGSSTEQRNCAIACLDFMTTLLTRYVWLVFHNVILAPMLPNAPRAAPLYLEF